MSAGRRNLSGFSVSTEQLELLILGWFRRYPGESTGPTELRNDLHLQQTTGMRSFVGRTLVSLAARGLVEREAGRYRAKRTTP